MPWPSCLLLIECFVQFFAVDDRVFSKLSLFQRLLGCCDLGAQDAAGCRSFLPAFVAGHGAKGNLDSAQIRSRLIGPCGRTGAALLTDVRHDFLGG